MTGESSSHVVGSRRRLAAILAADIAGYSRLVGADEEGTIARVKRYRREIIEPTLAEHNGTIVKNTGDGFLAMFDSPVEAVRCAIVIQQSMAARNTAIAREQWIQFRIGVNLGDVIVDSDDIYGEGVNIAARLENIAEPGGVNISGGVYEQIKNKLVVGYQSLGDEKLKNITDPVRIYRVLPDPSAVVRATRRGRLSAISAVVVVGVGTIAWFTLQDLWMVARRTPLSAATSSQPTGAAPTAIPGLPSPPQPPAPVPGAAFQGAPPSPIQSPSQVAAVPPPHAPPTPHAPGSAFRDCQGCPEMVVIPRGTFRMGSELDSTEKPIRPVSVQAYALGRSPVTLGEWRRCVAAQACLLDVSGEDAEPVRNVSWTDAQQFVSWLSKLTQQPYRLPTEAEWEYAARGGSETRYWWGEQIRPMMANCRGCGEPYDSKTPLPTGSGKPNPFGLYGMAGGVAQWVLDCWHPDYRGAPSDASPREAPNCREHVLRGGSWRAEPSDVRAASRAHYDTGVRYPTHGLRVARPL